MIRRLLRVVCLALAASAFYCDAKTAAFFLPGATSPQTGNLTGLVLNGAIPIAGATIGLSGTPARSTSTGADGKFNFLDLNVGPYTINTVVPLYTCAPVTVNIQVDATATANVSCKPAPGSITGTIRRGSGGLSGGVVTASQNGVAVKSATTGADGSYTISDLPPGTYRVSVAEPPNTVCERTDVEVKSGAATKADLTCFDIPATGTLTAVVRLDGTPEQGVVVTVTQNGTQIFSGPTDATGTFTLLSIPAGNVSVSVTPLPGTTCTPAQTVVIERDKTTIATFDCTSVPGSVAGSVTLDGSIGTGVVVTLTRPGSPDVTTSADLFGRYSFSNVVPGSYTLTATQSGVTCSPSPQNITVQTGQQTTANFACTTTPVQFTVTLAPSYRHIVAGVSSETCVRITTTPPRVGATVTVTWRSGNVVVGTRPLTTDAAGEALDRQPINVIATYDVTVVVTSNGVTVTQTGSIQVTSAQGTCPAP